MNKERDYYKAVRRAATAINSPKPLKERLLAVVDSTARSMHFAVSVMLLDSSGSKLVHVASRSLPQFYLHKGLLDSDKSLSEVVTGQTVVIADAAADKRVQYPEMAAKAGIVSILGVPVMSGDRAIGSIRVYTRERYEFNSQDIAFVTTVANLVAVALNSFPVKEKEGTDLPENSKPAGTALQRARSVTFAHPSEEEFARILDFYNIEWVYEPRSFPLQWDGDAVTEMFTPDFYLPKLDLYIELTTVKKTLVTHKNRKLRRLKELYPEVKITLLYKNDYDRLLAKYDCGPLAQTRAHGISRVLYSAPKIEKRVHELAAQITRDYADRRPLMIGVQRGFICFMADLIRQITVPVDIDFMAISYYTGGSDATTKVTKDIDLKVSGRHVILVEDIIDTGITVSYVLSHLQSGEPASLAVCTLLDRRARRLADVRLDYVGFEVPDEFVVGYGLDYKEEYRNLPFIGIPTIEKPAKSGLMKR